MYCVGDGKMKKRKEIGLEVRGSDLLYGSREGYREKWFKLIGIRRWN